MKTWSGLHIVKVGKGSRAVKNIDQVYICIIGCLNGVKLGEEVRDSENTGLVIQVHLHAIGQLHVPLKRGRKSTLSTSVGEGVTESKKLLKSVHDLVLAGPNGRCAEVQHAFPAVGNVVLLPLGRMF